MPFCRRRPPVVAPQPAAGGVRRDAELVGARPVPAAGRLGQQRHADGGGVGAVRQDAGGQQHVRGGAAGAAAASGGGPARGSAAPGMPPGRQPVPAGGAAQLARGEAAVGVGGVEHDQHAADSSWHASSLPGASHGLGGAVGVKSMPGPGGGARVVTRIKSAPGTQGLCERHRDAHGLVLTVGVANRLPNHHPE